MSASDTLDEDVRNAVKALKAQIANIEQFEAEWRRFRPSVVAHIDAGRGSEADHAFLTEWDSYFGTGGAS